MGGTHTGRYGIKTYEAGEAITAYTVCYLKSDGKVYMIDDTAKPPVFIALEAIASGAKGTFALAFPTCIVRCGGTVTLGSLVQVTTDGEIVDATTDNVWVLGQALEAGSDHSYAEVALCSHVTNDVSALDAD